MRRFALCMLCVMSGCADEPVLVKPVAVDMPVVMPCGHFVEQPVWARETLHGDEGIFDKTKTLIAENEQRRAYEARIEAILKGCLAQ